MMSKRMHEWMHIPHGGRNRLPGDEEQIDAYGNESNHFSFGSFPTMSTNTISRTVG
jgi:hypothetical protein